MLKVPYYLIVWVYTTQLSKVYAESVILPHVGVLIYVIAFLHISMNKWVRLHVLPTLVEVLATQLTQVHVESAILLR